LGFHEKAWWFNVINRGLMGFNQTHLVIKWWCDTKTWEFCGCASWRCGFEPMAMGISLGVVGSECDFVAIVMWKIMIDHSAMRFRPISRHFHISDCLQNVPSGKLT
jgi:hypothetical protein